MDTRTHISVPADMRFSYVNTALTETEDLAAFFLACNHAIKNEYPALGRREVNALIAAAMTSKFADLEDLLDIEYI